MTEIQILKGGMRRRYPGCFPAQVEDTIKKILDSKPGGPGPVLHLFSGSSDIGDVRVDLDHPAATHHTDVLEFVDRAEAKQKWEWIVLDPDYYKKPLHRKEYAKRFCGGLAGDVKKQQKIKAFLTTHAENILWFDVVAPFLPGFEIYKAWVFLPGGFFRVRILTWYKRIKQDMG